MRIGRLRGIATFVLAGCSGSSGLMHPPDGAAPADLAVVLGPDAGEVDLGGDTGPDGGCAGLDPTRPAPPPPSLATLTGAANDACVGARQDPPGAAQDTNVSGVLHDVQDDNIVVGAVVSVYTDAAQVLAGKPVTTSAPSDMNGHYSVLVPKGFYRVIFGNQGGKAMSNGNPVDTVDVYEIGRAFDDGARRAVKVSTREAIPGLVSVLPDIERGWVFGEVRDCDEALVGGAVARVTGSGYDSETDRLGFYFVLVNGSTLPTRTQRWTSPANGLFVALNVTPGSAAIQVDGMPLNGAWQRISSATAPVVAGAMTFVQLSPGNAPPCR